MDADRERTARTGKWLTIVTGLTGVLVVSAVTAEDPNEGTMGEPVPAVAPVSRPRLVVNLRAAEQRPAPPTAEKKRVDALPTGIGMHLFPPPGTSPPKSGIIVPENFELPPGYVRHNQTTDDGKCLRAILMFHPDYEVVDEQGNLIEIPEDRVVPPALAPPGLGIEILEVPTVTYPTPPTKDWKRPGEKP